MNFLIVYSHFESKSFNHALKEVAVSTLKTLGHKVNISDLYKMGFKAVADKHDFLELNRLDFFKYEDEQLHAYKHSMFSPDIKEEQEKIIWADWLIFIFPLWWYSTPAILRGWFDRVFSNGFAYEGNNVFENGLLKGKNALLTVTTGVQESLISKNIFTGDLERILIPINYGILFFSGINVYPTFCAYAVNSISENERESYLQKYKALISNIQNIIPYNFCT